MHWCLGKELLDRYSWTPHELFDFVTKKHKEIKILDNTRCYQTYFNETTKRKNVFYRATFINLIDFISASEEISGCYIDKEIDKNFINLSYSPYFWNININNILSHENVFKWKSFIEKKNKNIFDKAIKERTSCFKTMYLLHNEDMYDKDLISKAQKFTKSPYLALGEQLSFSVVCKTIHKETRKPSKTYNFQIVIEMNEDIAAQYLKFPFPIQNNDGLIISIRPEGCSVPLKVPPFESINWTCYPLSPGGVRPLNTMGLDGIAYVYSCAMNRANNAFVYDVPQSYTHGSSVLYEPFQSHEELYLDKKSSFMVINGIPEIEIQNCYFDEDEISNLKPQEINLTISEIPKEIEPLPKIKDKLIVNSEATELYCKFYTTLKYILDNKECQKNITLKEDLLIFQAVLMGCPPSLIRYQNGSIVFLNKGDKAKIDIISKESNMAKQVNMTRIREYVAKYFNKHLETEDFPELPFKAYQYDPVTYLIKCKVTINKFCGLDATTLLDIAKKYTHGSKKAKTVGK